MNRITEDEIEQWAIQLLKDQGYQYIYGPDLAPNGIAPERETFADLILSRRLKEAIRKINPTLPASACEEAYKQVRRLHSPDLLANNESFHRMMTEGVKVTYQKEGHQRGDLVWLIDFQHPQNNEFLVVNQFTIIENGQNKRPDVILFVNGLPLIVLELKNARDENANISTAYKQIQTYKATIPSLFTFNSIIVLSDGLEARAGTVSSGISRFMTWRSADGKTEASKLKPELETMIQGMLNPATLLDLMRHFIVFERSKNENTKSGITQITSIKKLAAYHQYYAVNRAVESTLRATGLHPSSKEQSFYQFDKNLSQKVVETPESYNLPGVKNQPAGDRKGGVVWHTQGSGKSLSMVFYTGKIVLTLNNPTVLIITDRNDLDDQLFGTFAASKQLLRQDPKQAENGQELKEFLKVVAGGVIFTTIQKFQPNEGNVYEVLSERENIVVIADEAHRTQYGFKAKIDKNTGEIKYGFAKYMRDALPNATYLGFTGTPIESSDINTPAVFGNYVDIYDIAQAVEDKATVPILYESRLAKIKLSEPGKKMVQDLDEDLQTQELSQTQRAKAKWTQLEALIGSPDRLGDIALDIVTHFEQRQEVFEGKGMIVCMSRRIAVALYNEMVKLKPDWHDEDLSAGGIKVVMTAASSDGPELAEFHTNKQQRKALADRLKDPHDALKLAIVCDMWLTGFDAPSLHTLYIDKPMKGHGLMQAIARVNRVYLDKPAGLVVDYLGIASDLKKALRFYSDAGGKGDPTIAQEEAVRVMLEKMEIVTQLYHGFDYEPYFEGETQTKLALILAAEDHVLGLDDGKKRYIDQVTALSKAFAIAIPHEEAMDVKDEVAFFQAVKARLVKFDQTGSGKTNVEIETTIRQVIDKALVSEGVVDIFDAAGIKKPDISILSDEFMLELKGMKHKNIALEVLKKILNDEIKSRSKTNLVKSRSLMEMLEEAIKKYYNKVLTAAEFIDELISVGKEVVASDSEAAELGLTEFEYAFYTAVAENDSAKELMQKDKLRELAIALTESLRKNATIDWTVKENVRAKLRIAVKRMLRKFGYPPDMQKLATETVLKQAEKLANELTKTP